MSPEGAKVFIVEDYQEILDTLTTFLTRKGHELVGSANTLEAALAALPQLPELETDVLILDANLTRGVETGADAQQILAAMAALNSDITVVGFSGSGSIEGANFNVSKPNVGELVKLITGL